MPMSQINTFMSDGALNEDAEITEFARGAWSFVAGKQRGRSGEHIGAGARHLAATSLSLSARRRFGLCYATLRTKEQLASTRLNFQNASGSLARSAFGVE